VRELCLSDKIYISTIADDADSLAREYGFGLEIAEFCTALNMDESFEKYDAQVRDRIRSVERLIFHAPFNELCPAAIDPLIVDVAKMRYAQAYDLMRGYGVNRMVVHSGFVPMIYFEEWFVEKSVSFWRDFLTDKPEGLRVYIENVLERSPEMLCDIVSAVNDERLGLCLDIGHASHVKSDITINEWAEHMLPFLGHVHLHNNYGERDTHNAPGDGIVDVAALIRLVAQAAPDVTFTVETIDGRSSVKWLESIGFLGVMVSGGRFS